MHWPTSARGANLTRGPRGVGGRGRLFVLSGPSGVGKDAALSGIKELGRPYHFPVTATTRRIRPGERDGIDYIFLSDEQFKQLIAAGDLLEWAEVYGNLYGIPKSGVIEALERGECVIVKIDVQGAATVRRMLPDAVLIFLEPPGIGSLDTRLRLRNTDSADELRLKIESARDEIAEADWFDYRVINADGQLDAAVAAIDEIVRREICCSADRRPATG